MKGASRRKRQSAAAQDRVEATGESRALTGDGSVQRRTTPENRFGTPTITTTTRHNVQFISSCYTQRGPTPARRNTPFRQVPSKRKIPPNSPLLEENIDPVRISSLLHKQWTLYSVTPMYKFSYANFKDYSKLLSAFITAEKQKGLAVEVGIDLNMKVTFSSVSGLKGSEHDQGAVFIQVTSRLEFSAPNTEEKVVWTGCLWPTFGDTDVLSCLTNDFTCLPLFFVNGLETLTALVRTWFQKAFDCYFSRLVISARDLTWMAAMWTGCKLERQTAATEFLFSVPRSPCGLDISYAIHPDDARALWESIHKSQDEVTEEEVNLFMNSLYSHFFRHFKIYLSAMRLVKVSTAVASAHCDGKVKFLSTVHVIGVLALLTELAINQIQY
ncbi:centromere protein L [Rhinatrema bivittatum]|uniref:centromere protein L n=1 Tax=Rhinatrema bivittatum TaxID=194408 RepID=UPI00112C2456|nr:centromere protein L [Rhinatrema bivittatum]